MASDTLYGKFGQPSMPVSKCFELLLRIRESVGSVVFLDALALLGVSPYPTTPPPEAGEGEAWGEEVGADVGGGVGGRWPETIDDAIETYGIDRVLECLKRAF